MGVGGVAQVEECLLPHSKHEALSLTPHTAKRKEERKEEKKEGRKKEKERKENKKRNRS
jgi:hypothetical protein